jgi:hypothetical protein
MHRWGDPGVDWQGINDAAAFIGGALKTAGIHVADFKEKFGTVRVYCDLGDDHHDVYKATYAEALKRWPHLHREILDGADYYELIVSLEEV